MYYRRHIEPVVCLAKEPLPLEEDVWIVPGGYI
jgi:hypothetical protein